MTALNWSERVEPNDRSGAVHDCYVAAPLSCLVFAGFTAFPNGIYTVIEREALERSDDQPDEEGGSPADADLGIKRRYNLAMHQPPATASKRTVLTTPDLAVSVGGIPADAPIGSPIRKYLGAYPYGHRITWLTSEGAILDPMAPMESAPVPCPLADVLAFASSRSVTDLRYVTRNEFAAQGGIGGGIDIMGLSLTLPAPAVAGTLAIPAGCDSIRVSDATHYKVPAAVARPAVACALTAPSGAESGWAVDLDGDTLHFIRVSDVPAGAFKPNALPPAPDTTPYDQADLDSAKAAGHTAGYADAKSKAVAAVEAI